MHKRKILILVALSWSLIGIQSASAVQVTLNVVDQDAVQITGSLISVPGIGTFATGTTVEIPEGIRDFTVIPGRNGVPGNYVALKILLFSRGEK